MNVRIRENIFTVSEFSETAYFFFMVSKIFGNPLICKKIFMLMSGKFYLLHIVGGFRWMNRQTVRKQISLT